MVDAQPRLAVGKACPYSTETVMACGRYEPMSAHGDHPDAAMCRYALVVWITPHLRRLHCRRQDPMG